MNRTIRLMLVLAAMALLPRAAWAKVENGNDLARDYTYEENAMVKKRIKREALKKLFYFRYLYIDTIEEGMTNNYSYIRMSTIEPSSDMRVNFTVVKPVSKKKIHELNIGRGDGIAITGRLKSIDEKKSNEIVLEPVIVRHKDKLAPVRSLEMLYDLDPNATYYSYTGAGKDKVVRVPAKYKDILPGKGKRAQMINSMGPEGFADYLLKKLEERKKAD